MAPASPWCGTARRRTRCSPASACRPGSRRRLHERGPAAAALTAPARPPAPAWRASRWRGRRSGRALAGARRARPVPGPRAARPAAAACRSGRTSSLLAGFAGAARRGCLAGLPRLRLARCRCRRTPAGAQSGLRAPAARRAGRPARPADDPVALALWQVHRGRALAAIRRLRVGTAAAGPGAARPARLRAALGLSLVAALVIAGGEAPERLRRALLPACAAPAPAAGRCGWRPGSRRRAYTGAAPVFLDPAGGASTVPAGSRLQVAVSGGAGGVPELRADGGAATPVPRARPPQLRAPRRCWSRACGSPIRRDGRELVRWSLTVQADAPPRARLHRGARPRPARPRHAPALAGRG